MSGATKILSIMYLGSLICLSASVPAQSQSAEEISVPEPTLLHAVVEADGSAIVRSELLGEVNSADSTATVSVIDVEGSDGKRIRAVKISLGNSASSDRIYIPESLLSSFQNELRELESTRHWYGKCRAKLRCVHGIARCRPSETEIQAYCPGRYSTPGSEEGFVLSTPRDSFSFPSVNAAQLGDLIGKAILVVE